MQSKKWILIAVLIVLIALCACAGAEEKQLQILVTSDLHGYFRGYDYFSGEPVDNAGVSRVASVIRQVRAQDPDTLVVDAGDIFQDNFAELFLPSSGYDGLHPMAAAMNAAGYDAWVTGNHDFNFGLENLSAYKTQMNAVMLCGNVYKDGEPLGQPYVIIEKNGLRIALIGMVTPNIVMWDARNLSSCEIRDSVNEINRCIEEIGDKADLFVGVLHMGLDEELGTKNSGCKAIAAQCPGLDLILSAHSHAAFADVYENGKLIVENKNYGQTVVKITVNFVQDETGRFTMSKATGEVIDCAGFEEDETVLNVTNRADAEAKAEATREIGTLEGADLVSGLIAGDTCTVAWGDTPWMQLVADCMRYYTGADVAATFAMNTQSEVKVGSLTNASISTLYAYNNNTLYLLRMTGKQLRTYLEWAVAPYNTFTEGDLTISYRPGIRFYNLHMLDGVCYTVDISREPGDRITELTWPDGTPVQDDDSFTIAVSNYTANSQLTVPGVIFAEDEDMPEILQIDVAGDIGGMQRLLADYIKNVLGSKVVASCDNNWHLVGCDWDEAAHDAVMQALNNGTLHPEASEDGRTPNVRPLRSEDIPKPIND